MTLVNYILRKVIENSKYDIFNVCPMFCFKEIPNKFEAIKKQVVENNFFDKKQKKVYMELFSTAQKHYYSFGKIAKIWKTRKYGYYNNDRDMYFNKLDKFPSSQKITLSHFNKKYVFRLTDLINIWHRSLTKNIGLSPSPIYPKNPYINKPFRKYHLYLIYLRLMDSTLAIPLLIQQFFKLELNIVKFEINAYTILKDITIKNYIDETSDVGLMFDCVNMLESLRIELNYVYIDSRLPESCIKEVVATLKPYLKDYLIGTQSCNPIKKDLAFSKAVNGLKCFFLRNPSFGTLRYFGISTSHLSLTTALDDISENISTAETDIESPNEMEISDSEI